MVKHAKSLQTGCADLTVWSTILFSMMSFAAELAQNMKQFYTRTRQKYELKADQPKLCVCVFFFIIIILGSTFRQRTFKRIVCFSFSVLFCLSRKPNAIASMLL